MQRQQRQRDAAVALQRQIEQQRHEQQLAENDDSPESIGERDIAADTTAMDAAQEDSPALIPEQILSELVPDQDPTLKEPPTPPTSSNLDSAGRPQLYPSTQAEDDVRKPAAEHRDKYVRTLPQNKNTVDSDALGFERPAFPAFYKVSEDDGAAVYNDGEAITFEIRRVPFGVVVLGQELSWRSVDEDGSNCLMVRVPGGWVRDSQLKRITAVPL